MCGIFCSFNVDTFNELAILNQYRGNVNHSISGLTLPSTNMLYVNRFNEPYNPVTDLNGADYLIGHIQAPTGQYENGTNIHPTVCEDELLWHNGILKEFEIERLQIKHNTMVNWDSFLLLKEISQNVENLSTIDGSFAGLFYSNEKELFIFRNVLAPLYYDVDLNISSTKFKNSVLLTPNIVFKVCFKSMCFIQTKLFETKNNPYDL